MPFFILILNSFQMSSSSSSTSSSLSSLPWSPTVVDTQVLKIGQLLVVALPGEFTTMAGRRVRRAVEEEVAALALATGSSVMTGVMSMANNNMTSMTSDNAMSMANDNATSMTSDNATSITSDNGMMSLANDNSTSMTNDNVMSMSSDNGLMSLTNDNSTSMSSDNGLMSFTNDNMIMPATKVVLSGLTNCYASYVTTFEEYQLQRCVGQQIFFCKIATCANPPM